MHQTPRILIVDDEPLVASALQRLLAGHAFEVEVAGSAEEALERLSTRTVDAVLTDQWMPGLKGQQLLRRLAVEHPEVLRLIMSGSPGRIERPCHAIQASFEKPWDTRALVGTLRDLLERRRSSRAGT